MRIVLRGFWISLVTFPGILAAQLGPNGATASFKGSLPPPATVRLSLSQGLGVAVRLDGLEQEFEKVKGHVRAADAHIFLKAVRYARDFEEWYDKTPEESARKAHSLLAEAESRIEALKHGQTPWMEGSGQKVLGFYSQIDGSPQPYGVEIPEGLKWGGDQKEVPMWIWLHGRGDTAPDLNFVYSRLTAKKPGQFQPKGTIVIHPFGRYCNGWKSAGETDVFECRDDAEIRFNVDGRRIALAGFSMGGAGAWHLGAHHAGHWACVNTGAGFVDVKRYQKLTPDKYPAWYEQKLWGVYDVPDYARNFFNVPLICYSGEQDAQRDSAEYMIEVLGKEGIKPPHLIGPGMGHKYHPETIKEVQAWIENAVEKGRDPWPKKVSIQTKTLEFGVGGSAWAGILGLEEHWKDSRLDAEVVSEGVIHVTTQGVTHCYVRKPSDWSELPEYRIRIDGQELVFPKILSGKPKSFLKRVNGKWNAITSSELGFAPTRKDTSFMGPIDHIFKWRFTVVLPDGPGNHPKVDQWVKEESQHFLKRWRSLMRGDVRVIKAGDVTEKELNDLNSSLVLWGDPQSNKWIRHFQEKLPIRWDAESVGIGKKSFNADSHLPVMIYPVNFPEGGARYVVLNSGLTFREAHDRTNSLQNPKLPDWAILDITQPPSNESAGKVVEADFFDESWQVKTSTPAR